MPLMKPSTTCRATSSRFPMRDSTTGSTNRAPGTDEVVNKSFSLFSCPFSHPRSWHRHGIKQSIDQGVGGDPFRLRMEIRQHAMPEDRVRHGPDVVEAHVIAAARQRSRLGTKDEILRRTHAAAKGDPPPAVLPAGRRPPAGGGRG